METSNDYQQRTAPQLAMMFAAVDRLDATDYEKAMLRFYGDWDMDTVTPENSQALAVETLGHLRAEIGTPLERLNADHERGDHDGPTFVGVHAACPWCAR